MPLSMRVDTANNLAESRCGVSVVPELFLKNTPYVREATISGEVQEVFRKSSNPEMDRTRGLFVLGNKEANRMGWLACKVNLDDCGAIEPPTQGFSLLGSNACFKSVQLLDDSRFTYRLVRQIEKPSGQQHLHRCIQSTQARAASIQS